MFARYPNNSNVRLKSKDCVDGVLQPLVDHIDIKINGSLSSRDLYQTVLNMAVNKNSVHSVSKRYQNTRSETSIWHHLNKLGMDELIQVNEQILIQECIKSLKPGKKYEFAIDYTNDPYYGKIDSSNDRYVIRGQTKKVNKLLLFICIPLYNYQERKV